MKINIAIDGPSASGKSTVAKELCKRLNYKHLDTGAMYRCVALKVVRNNVNYNDKEAMNELLENTTIDFSEDGKVLLDGEDVTSEIRTDEISMMASNVSTKKEVRKHLVALQQKIAMEKGYIMDGRDIGTVVLPNAELKIYMVADVEIRAKRRFRENKQRGIDSNLLELEQEIMERDYQDTHRKNSPLKKAADAIEIDTSDMSINDVVEAVYELAKERI